MFICLDKSEGLILKKSGGNTFPVCYWCGSNSVCYRWSKRWELFYIHVILRKSCFSGNHNTVLKTNLFIFHLRSHREDRTYCLSEKNTSISSVWSSSLGFMSKNTKPWNEYWWITDAGVELSSSVQTGLLLFFLWQAATVTLHLHNSHGS